MYCFGGLSHANYALSEVHNPARTLRIAGPLAVIVAGAFYLLCNVAYYAAASKEEITSSGRLVAALLFKNVWGSKAERFLNAFIALSALGSVLSIVCLSSQVLSQQCLIIHEVVLPWSRESSARKGRRPPIQLVLGIQLARGSTTRGPWPSYAPNALFSTIYSYSKDWTVCIIVIFAVPPGDAFNFMMNMVGRTLILLSTQWLYFF